MSTGGCWRSRRRRSDISRVNARARAILRASRMLRAPRARGPAKWRLPTPPSAVLGGTRTILCNVIIPATTGPGNLDVRIEAAGTERPRRWRTARRLITLMLHCAARARDACIFSRAITRAITFYHRASRPRYRDFGIRASAPLDDAHCHQVTLSVVESRRLVDAPAARILDVSSRISPIYFTLSNFFFSLCSPRHPTCSYRTDNRTKTGDRVRLTRDT